MGAIESTRRVLEAIEGASHRVSASVACGQMHGTVLVGNEGQLAFDSIQLWDDKRPSEEVSAFIATHDVDGLWPIAANPSSVAWPGFKLRWTANHQPESLARAASLLMPKDYVNLRLTGTLGMGRVRRVLHVSLGRANRRLEPELTSLLGVDGRLLFQVRAAHVLLGAVSPKAADTRLSRELQSQ